MGLAHILLQTKQLLNFSFSRYAALAVQKLDNGKGLAYNLLLFKTGYFQEKDLLYQVLLSKFDHSNSILKVMLLRQKNSRG